MTYNDYGFNEWNGFKGVPEQITDNLTAFKIALCDTLKEQTETQKESAEKINDSIKEHTQVEKQAITEVKTEIQKQTEQQKADAKAARETQTTLFSNLVSAIKNISWRV